MFSYWWLRRKLRTGSALQQRTCRHLGVAGEGCLVQPRSPEPVGAGTKAQPVPWGSLRHDRSAAGWQCHCPSSALLAVYCTSWFSALWWRGGKPWLAVGSYGARWNSEIETQWIAQWATDFAFSPCAASDCLHSLLSSTRNIIFNPCVSCPCGSSQWQVELIRTQRLSLKSGWSLILCPDFLSPKPKSSCFKKLFIYLFLTWSFAM